MNPTRQIFYILCGIGGILTLALGTQILETNHAGYVQVKQAAGTGHMSVRTEPGVYLQMFGDINTYRISDIYDFSSEVIPVRFNDAAQADITGQIKYRLPSDPVHILQINQDFRGDDNVQEQLVRQAVAAAIRQTASMFKAEEVYSTRRSEFVQLVNDQIKNGLYQTTFSEVQRKDEDGNIYLDHNIRVSVDAQGHPLISEPSVFKRYGVELVQFIMNDPKFDDKTNELIAKRKEADQEKVVARAKAERAKQDALTAEAQGKANVATAEAEALVEKKKATVAAERDTEVAQQKALQAKANAEATLAQGEADAKAAQLKVNAGLTPLDRANIEKETAIGVAEKLSMVKFPQMMIIGGGDKGPMNPFDAVGLDSFIKISKGLSQGAADVENK